MSRDFVLTTSRNNKLSITAFGLDNIGSFPCIIFVHGFKGFKDWGFGPYIGNFFAKQGYFVLTFNFSHNGIGENRTEFTELNKFAENTLSLETEELSELIDAYFNGFFGKIENRNLGLIGHSRGGAISLLTASKSKDVTATAIWSAVSNFDRYTERQKIEWKKRGFLEIQNQRTKQLMRLNSSLLEDIEKNAGDSLNILKAAENIKKPLLIIHGEQDLSVKISDGEEIYKASDKSLTEFYKISQAGHTFDIKHPFEGSNLKFEKVLKKTKEFFNTNLH